MPGNVFLKGDQRQRAEQADQHDGYADAGLFNLYRRNKAADAVIHDKNAGTGDKSRLNKRRNGLGFAMTVTVIGIGRLGGYFDGDKSD